MIDLAEPKMLDDFEQAEIDDPTPRKEVDGRIIYISRQLQVVPTAIGLPVLGDFGSAEWGEEQNKRDAQPNPSALQKSFLNFLGVMKSIFGTSAAW